MQTAAMDQFVARVRDNSDILSVASRYVTFTRKGNRYWACCPFHSEKTPSFTVDPGKGFYHCFGCGVGGNVFNLIAGLEHISYFDAVKLQARRLNIPIPTDRPRTVAEIESEREEKLLYEVNERARTFFHNCLTVTPYGKPALEYLAGRGISEDIISDFKLGYAPNDWDKLSTAFVKRGISTKTLIDAGLVGERSRDSGLYDRFRNRVMIPIVDQTGHVLAFGGRILDSIGVQSTDAPKYLNSPETRIFNKRRVLFGLDRAAPSIGREGFAIVVEGYMDAISLVAAGIKNVVATLGTAFTLDHARILSRYARRIVFCYDSDDAGQRATMRALPIITDANAQAAVIIVPDGKDPDDFVRKHGGEAFRELAANAMPMIDYRIKYVLEHSDHQTLDGKINALREILSSIAKMHDSALRNEYGRKLASALDLDQSTVNSEWKNISIGRASDASPARVVKINTVRAEAQSDAAWRSWRTLIRTGWHATDLLEHALATIPIEEFPKIHREIVTYIEKCIKEERRPDDVSAAQELSSEALSELSECLVGSSEELTTEEVQSYMDSIKLLRVEFLSRRYQKLMNELEKHPRGSPEFAAALSQLQRVKGELDVKKF